MIWLFASFILYTLNNFLWKWAVQNEIPVILINRRSVFTFLFVLLAYVYVSRGNFSFVYDDQFFWVVISCLLGVTGLIFLVSFLKEGSFTVMSYYSFLGITINSLLTYLIGHVEISNKMLFSGIFLLIGYIIFIWDESRKVIKKTIPLSQHLFLLGMTVCFSLSYFISWTALKHFEPLQLMVTQEFFVFLITSIVSVFVASKLKINPVKISFKYPMLASVIMFAAFCGFMGLKQYNPIITSISGVISPLLALIGGIIFFKEKVNMVQIISFVIIFVSEFFFILT